MKDVFEQVSMRNVNSFLQLTLMFVIYLLITYIRFYFHNNLDGTK